MGMRPTEILLENLGLLSGRYPLNQVTLIVGPNRSGKTTLMRGIELAITGDIYDPEQARNLTFDELTAPGIDMMRVRLAFDNGFWVERKFQRSRDNGKVSVKQTLDFQGISPSAMGKSRQAESELARFLTPSRYGLHLTAIVDAKTTERRKILLDMLVGSPTGMSLPDWIYSEIVDKGECTTEDQGELSKMVASYCHAVPAEILALDALSRINLAVDADLKASKSELDEITSIIRDLGFGTGEMVDTSEIPKLEEVLRNTWDDVRELSEHIGSCKADAERHENLQAQIEKITESERLIGEVRNAADVENDRQRLASAKKGDIEEANKIHDRRVQKAGEKQTTDQDQIDNDRNSLIVDQRTNESDRAGKLLRIKALDSEMDNYAEKIGSIEELSELEEGEHHCPLCGSAIDTAKLTGLWQSEIDQRMTERLRLEDDVEALRIKDLKIGGKSLDLDKSRKEIRNRHERELEELKRSRNETLRKIEDEYREPLESLDKEIQALHEVERLRQSRIEKEKELSEIQILEIGQIEENVQAKNRDMATLENKLSKLRLAENDAKRKADLEVKQFARSRSVRCLSAIKKVTGAQGIPGLLLREKIEPFIRTVNDVLHRFAPDMEFGIEFQDDRGKESCQFGFRANGLWTLFESASGMEKYLILFAIVVALVNREKWVTQRLIIMDEISKLDDEMAAVLVDAAQVVVADKLVDCVLLAGALRDSDLEHIMERQLTIFGNMIVCKKGREPSAA